MADDSVTRGKLETQGDSERDAREVLVASVSDTESRLDGDFDDWVVLALLPRECKNSGGKF